LQTHLVIDLPATMTLLGPPAYDRGSGCTGTQKIDCYLDYIPNDGSTKVVFAVRVSGSGAQQITATASSDRESNAADNTATLTLQVTTPTTPTPVAKPLAVKPLLGKPSTLPLVPVAGKRFTLTLPVNRSDTLKPLNTARIVGTPFLSGKAIKHSSSFAKGKARVTLFLPKSAKNKQLKLKITITAAAQTITRTFTYRVR
jgi:hypothetical protein